MSHFIFLVVQHYHASPNGGDCQRELPYNLDYGKLRTADEGGGDGGKQRSTRAVLRTCTGLRARAWFRVRGSAKCNCELFCKLVLSLFCFLLQLFFYPVPKFMFRSWFLCSFPTPSRSFWDRTSEVFLFFKLFEKSLRVTGLPSLLSVLTFQLLTNECIFEIFYKLPAFLAHASFVDKNFYLTFEPRRSNLEKNYKY